MHFKDVSVRRSAGLIRKVIVARLYKTARQTAAHPRMTDYVRESEFRYLVLFVPDPKKIPLRQQTQTDYFLFRDKLGCANTPGEIRWYHSLFTVTQHLAEWGFDCLDYIDLTANSRADFRAMISEGLKEFAARRNARITPIQDFLDDLIQYELRR